MSLTQKAALFALALLTAVPCSAAGSPPPNVRQINAERKDGALTVTWTPVEDPKGISFYRIYFSHTSILGNSGNYDDFQQTNGPETSYVFPSLPVKEAKIFLSVLAVNKAGLESEGFETEVEVAIPGETPPEEPPAVVPQGIEGTTAQPMIIVSVSPTSATEILVTFSKPIADGADIRPGTFVVTDGSGATFPITAVEVRGDSAMLSLAPQIPEKGYLLGLLQNVPAADGTNATPSLPTIAFRGFLPAEPSPALTPEPPPPPYGKNPFLAPTPPTIPYGRAPTTPPEDPSDLLLKAVRQRNGLFSILASWVGSPDSRRTLESYVLSTSNDGVRFDRNAVVNRTETSVQFNRLPPGIFGLRVASRDTKGNESAGIQKVIALPASGVGLLGILTASGMLAGQRLRRRRALDQSC